MRFSFGRGTSGKVERPGRSRQLSWEEGVARAMANTPTTMREALRECNDQSTVRQFV